jgi:predicted DNA-binding transcriptional regulator AlpA
MNGHSTREAAQKLGVSLASLSKYIMLKQIPVPPLTRVGGVRVRLWSDADIEHVRQLLPKIANGRKTRYSKLKQKPQPGAAVPHKQRSTNKKRTPRKKKP